jgi:preprotein translocase subunit SecD
MARPARRPTPARAGTPRPRRTLLLFLALVVALYGLLVGLDLKDGGGVWKPRLGLDLQGGTRITLQAEASSGDVTAAKLREARDIIDQRVNATGVSEAEVSTQGGNQVVIEIPGERRGNIVDEVGRTAQLRFRLLWGSGQSAPQPADAKAVEAAQKTVSSVDWSKLSLDQLIAAETQGLQSLPQQYAEAAAALQTELAGFRCTKDDLKVDDVANEPIVTCDPSSGETMILSPTVIEGTQVKSANAVVPQQSVEWVVALELKDAGTKAFDRITEALYQQEQAGNQQASRFAIVLDGEVLSAPTTNGHFTNGQSQISGGFTQATSQSLANQLKYGALPLTFEVNGVSVEGPSLAGSQLQAGIVAGAIGLVLVMAYLLLYYRGLGLVAIGSLVMAAAVSYATVLLLGTALGFTLTLPGIAGLIVAIGITADSFIVLFERIRDEVRDGKSLRLAVESGWERARRTILAADAVSLLAAVILFLFAIGVVRGFAFALGLTTLIDVLVVFGFTKPLMSLLARTRFFGRGHRLSGFDAAHLGIGDRAVDRVGPARPTRRTSAPGTSTGGRA